MLSAGEVSGELLAEKVILEIKKNVNFTYDFFGMGSCNLNRLGVRLLVNSKDFEVIGFYEVISKYTILKKAQKKLIEALSIEKPNLLILIDYIEFNLRLGAKARKLGIPVLFYVSPQIWAWKPNRIKRIEKSVSSLALILPFEKSLYKNSKVNTEYVGHPLIEILPFDKSKTETRLSSNLDVKVFPIISFLPGSRKSEINKHFNIIYETILKINKKNSKCVFLIVLAKPEHLLPIIKEKISKLVLKKIDVNIKISKTYDSIISSDIVAVCSGTASLEVALLGIPMVVFYKLSFLSYLIIRTLILVKYISLVNLILNKKTVSELIQNNMNSNKLTREIEILINSKSERIKQVNSFAALRKKLGNESASKNVANMACRLLKS